MKDTQNADKPAVGQPKHTQGIKTKINHVTLIVSMLSILILGIVALVSLVLMKSRTVEINTEMGKTAAEDSREILENEAMNQLRNIADSKAETVDARLQTIMNQVKLLAASAEELYAKPQNFGSIPVYPAQADLQGTFTAQIVYSERTPPDSVTDEVGLLGNLTVSMRKASEYLDGVGTTQIGTESGFIIMCDENSGLKTELAYLEPTERPWYRMAADSGTLTWSDVFEDSYGRGMSVTCGMPVYGPDGQLKAVLSIGSTLDDISHTIVNTTIGETGYAFVVDQNGDVIMSKNLIQDENGHVSNKENLLEYSETSMHEAAQHMIAGEAGVRQVLYDGKAVYLAYEPMETVPWTVVTVVDVEEVMAPSVESEETIRASTLAAGAEINHLIWLSIIFFLVAVAVAAGIAIRMGGAFSSLLSEPIQELEVGVKTISGGNLDYKLNIHTGDEIENLAAAFNAMTASLQKYIQDLTNITAEKERIGAELGVATQIQASMLPCIFPPFPTRHEFDIYATMTPAKEVGGDFYDFFLVDEDHLVLVMADVSGKGVPAALFMMIAKTLLKSAAQNGLSPHAVLEKVNNQLCENNDAEMFVTVWLGILEISTGKMVCANAGHEYPAIKRKDSGFELLKDKHGFVLAGMENVRFKEYQVDLQPGDAIFVYTDGVAEATNASEELFGTDRMLDALNKVDGRNCETLLKDVHEEINAFVGSAPQFDDITMLCLEITPQEPQHIFKAQPTEESVADAIAFIEQTLENAEIPPKAAMKINIAVDEIYSNIVNYSGASEASIQCTIENSQVTLVFSDNGVQYDPLAKADPDISLSADEREIGGLGIFMVKKSMDEMTYAYENGKNILILKKTY